MEFRGLRAQYRHLKPQIDKAVAEVLEEGAYIDGRQVEQLERELSQYIGTAECITCASGTDALLLLMLAWDIGAGDAVFLPDFTFFATAEAVARVGATPVFTDVRADTFTMDSDSLETAVQEVLRQGRLKPKAVLAVDLYGLPADYPKLESVARKYDLLLFQDCAQGFGGELNGIKSGSFGAGAAVSFFPAKPLGCYGDGGAVFTSNTEKAELMRSLKVHGKGTDKYDNCRVGLNSRLDTLQAAVLLVKLKAFRQYELTAVRCAAQLYTDLLSPKWNLPVVPRGYQSAWAQYTIRLESGEQRDLVRECLHKAGIPAMVYYPKPLSRQTAFAGLCNPVECPTAEALCKQVLSLPIHPYLTEEEIRCVVNVLEDK